jgi:hypothetical protein
MAQAAPAPSGHTTKGIDAVPTRRPAADPATGFRVVTVSQQAQGLAGIETIPLAAATHRRTLRAYGTVLLPEPLAHSRDRYVKDRAALATARAQLQYAHEEYRRLKSLYAKHEYITQEDLQAAKAKWRSDEAAAAAAETALRERQARIRQQWGPVLADWLYDATPQFEQVMQQQVLLIRITLPPGTALASPPSTALIETPTGARVTASLVSPAPNTDPRIQGLSFFYRTGNGAGLLPGMNVSARLAAGPALNGVILPTGAVVWWRGRRWAYHQIAADRFQRQPVRGGLPVREGWFVRRGFAPGQRIAVEGTGLLLSKELESLIRGGD